MLGLFCRVFFLPKIYRAFLIIVFLPHVLGKYYFQMLEAEVLSSYTSIRRKTSQTNTQRQQYNYSQNKVIL